MADSRSFTDRLRSLGIFGNKNPKADEDKEYSITPKEYKVISGGVTALGPAKEAFKLGVEPSKLMADKDVPTITRNAVRRIASEGGTKEEIAGMTLPHVSDETGMGTYNRPSFENYVVKPIPHGFKNAETAQNDIEKAKSLTIAQKRAELGFKDKNPITQSGIKGWDGKSMVKESTFFDGFKNVLTELDAETANAYITKNRASKTKVPPTALPHKKFEDYPEGKEEAKELSGPATGLVAQERQHLIGSANRAKTRADESTLIQIHCLDILNEFAIVTANLQEHFDKGILKNLKALTLTEELPTSTAPDIEEQTEPINESLFENMLTSMVPTFSQPMGHPELGLVKPFGGELDDTRDLGPATTPAKRKKRKHRQIAIAMGI